MRGQGRRAAGSVAERRLAGWWRDVVVAVGVVLIGRAIIFIVVGTSSDSCFVGLLKFIVVVFVTSVLYMHSQCCFCIQHVRCRARARLLGVGCD